MANIYEKIPCGGFRVDTTVLEFQQDPVSKDDFLTVTANIPVYGAEFLILKASDEDQLYKITVTGGNLKAEKYNP